MTYRTKLTIFAIALLLVLAAVFVAARRDNAGGVLGQLVISQDRAGDHSGVNVSSTPVLGLAGFSGRQWVRMEHCSGTEPVWYALSASSSTVSTSTGAKLDAGDVEYLTVNDIPWRGNIWLVANTSTEQRVCFIEK